MNNATPSIVAWHVLESVYWAVCLAMGCITPLFYCCVLDHVYGATAWQCVIQIRYAILVLPCLYLQHPILESRLLPQKSTHIQKSKKPIYRIVCAVGDVISTYRRYGFKSYVSNSFSLITFHSDKHTVTPVMEATKLSHMI